MSLSLDERNFTHVIVFWLLFNISRGLSDLISQKLVKVPPTDTKISPELLIARP